MHAGDQLGTAVEKRVSLPVQWNASMGAAVAIEVDLTLTANGEQVGVAEAKAATVAFTKVGGRAKEVHAHGLLKMMGLARLTRAFNPEARFIPCRLTVGKPTPLASSRLLMLAREENC